MASSWYVFWPVSVLLFFSLFIDFDSSFHYFGWFCILEQARMFDCKFWLGLGVHVIVYLIYLTPMWLRLARIHIDGLWLVIWDAFNVHRAITCFHQWVSFHEKNMFIICFFHSFLFRNSPDEIIIITTVIENYWDFRKLHMYVILTITNAGVIGSVFSKALDAERMLLQRNYN